MAKALKKHLFPPPCYSLLICCHPFSTTYIFSKNHQSLISICIISSLESTSCLIPSALHKTKHPADYVTLSNSPPVHQLTTLTLHHTFTVSFQAQNSPFPQIFSTIVCYHPPGLPSRIILDRTYSAQRFLGSTP